MTSDCADKELQLMLKDMKEQQSFYRPTPFWEKASKLLVKESFVLAVLHVIFLCLPMVRLAMHYPRSL